jgi:transcriptional regulator with XRE-family HTH domain
MSTGQRTELITARKRLGLSRDQAAGLVGISQQAVALYEAGGGGHSGPSYANLAGYCEALAALAADRGIAGDFSIEALCPDLFQAVAL